MYDSYNKHRRPSLNSEKWKRDEVRSRAPHLYRIVPPQFKYSATGRVVFMTELPAFADSVPEYHELR